MIDAASFWLVKTLQLLEIQEVARQKKVQTNELDSSSSCLPALIE
jgi:hypothetical protein